MNDQPKIILTAGGNPTGIISFPDASRRNEYAGIAVEYMKKNPQIEQFGFLEENKHLQMSGNEFCGGGACATARVISDTTGRAKGNFTMSGFPNKVDYQALQNSFVQCTFNDLKTNIKEIALMEKKATLVDMGGIIHIVLPSSIPFENKADIYTYHHKKIVNKLGLGERLAVGVIWQEETNNGIKIHPVVWVKDIDSFFYESASGSGSLATLLASDKTSMDIIQPSSEPIYAEIIGNDLTLRMEVIYTE